ncbi:MAG: hypothetical protein ACOC1F_05495 [Myxococcota bacterium]
MQKPQAREAFLIALQKAAPMMGPLLANNPTTLKALVEAVLDAGVEDARGLLLDLLGVT